MLISTPGMLMQVQRWVTLSAAVLRRPSRSIVLGLNVSIAILTVTARATALNRVQIGLPVATASMQARVPGPYPVLTLSRQSGHSAADCTEPRSAEGVECKKCNEGRVAISSSDRVLLIIFAVGHFAKDCPTGGGSFGCRNCLCVLHSIPPRTQVHH